MREVIVQGIGQTPVEEHWERSLRDLATEAGLAAMRDAGVDRIDAVFVGNMLSGQIAHQENLGALVADWMGQRGAEGFKVEAACASGAAAFRAAFLAVASGALDAVLAVGVEKMTETSGAETTAALASAADADFEGVQGISFVGLNALIMRRYLHEFGWKHTDFGGFSINAHANGARNPNARLREPITERDYARARMICEPINLLDASPIGDGAAAALLLPAEKVAEGPRPRIMIAGSAAATDSLAVHDRKDPLFLSAAHLGARRAYRPGGCGARGDRLLRTARRLQHPGRDVARSVRLRRTRAGAAAGARRRDPAGWKIAHLHPGRIEGARPSGRRDGDVPDCRDGPAIAGRGGRKPALQSAHRPGPEHRRIGRFDLHPHFESGIIFWMRSNRGGPMDCPVSLKTDAVYPDRVGLLA